jgi:hypothetical protein
VGIYLNVVQKSLLSFCFSMVHFRDCGHAKSPDNIVGLRMDNFQYLRVEFNEVTVSYHRERPNVSARLTESYRGRT